LHDIDDDTISFSPRQDGGGGITFFLPPRHFDVSSISLMPAAFFHASYIADCHISIRCCCRLFQLPR
jgi:hypothetical protein